MNFNKGIFWNPNFKGIHLNSNFEFLFGNII